MSVATLATAIGAQAPTVPAETSNATTGAQTSAGSRELRLTGRPLGVALGSSENRFSAQVWLRGQIRYSRPFDNEPLRAIDVTNRPGPSLDVPRARLNAQGHVFDPRIRFFHVHELSGPTALLDLGLDLEVFDGLDLRIGQSKALYNRERVDPSGQQQFVERSIATYAFTLDRQRGLTLTKEIGAATRASSLLTMAILDGEGREFDQRSSDLLKVVRWQWNFLGEPLSFSQSDVAVRQAPAASLAFGAARVRGPYTRFSGTGGGQLDGFDDGSADRYTLAQWLQELAWQYRGYSIQQEYHVKEITDHDLGRESRLRGGYLQAGKIWPVELAAGDLPLELALRYAQVDWDGTQRDRRQDELTAAINLFIDGHENKLTLDLSRLELFDEPVGRTTRDTRIRVQWEVSF